MTFISRISTFCSRNIDRGDWRVFETIYNYSAIEWFSTLLILGTHPQSKGTQCWLVALSSSLCWPLMSTLHRQASLLSVRRRFRRSNPSRSSPARRIVAQVRQLIGLVVVRLSLYFEIGRAIEHLYCVNNSRLQGKLGLHPSSIRRQRRFCAVL